MFIPLHLSKATFLGLIALAFWATSVAFTRTLCEALGPVTLGAIGFGGGGLISLCVELWRHRRISIFSPPAWPYLIFCGVFFIGYISGFVPALAMANDRQVALQLGIVNYLWPGLIVLGSVFILKYRARWFFLIPGLMIAFAGIMICMAGTLSFSLFLNAIRQNAVAFALMTGSAICWAIYSNGAHKYAPPNGASGVPLFQLVTGILFFIFMIINGAKPAWSVSLIGPLIYYMIFIVALSYLLWDLAMQKGHVVFLGAVSYLLPLASTLFAGFYFNEPLGLHLLAGAVLITLGAILSRYGVVPRT
ncbi:MAG: EamA family transporter [Kiritimatiellia bacterium]|nr:EamA family transporter [Kiritimatiellia bacterium]